jgi:hypothetical protein
MRTTWRLVDFADISESDFVETAHLALLGRPPSEVERSRRIAELRSGSSRLQVLVRLALSPEGRRTPNRPISGVGLPVLSVIGSYIERVAATRRLGIAVRRAEEAVRRHLRAPNGPRESR